MVITRPHFDPVKGVIDGGKQILTVYRHWKTVLNCTGGRVRCAMHADHRRQSVWECQWIIHTFVLLMCSVCVSNKRGCILPHTHTLLDVLYGKLHTKYYAKPLVNGTCIFCNTFEITYIIHTNTNNNQSERKRGKQDCSRKYIKIHTNTYIIHVIHT